MIWINVNCFLEKYKDKIDYLFMLKIFIRLYTIFLRKNIIVKNNVKKTLFLIYLNYDIIVQENVVGGLYDKCFGNRR